LQASWFFDGRANEIAPFGPRAVVVLDVLEAEQVLQHEPRVARTLADSAIRNHRLLTGDALRAVQRLQLLDGLERSVVIARLRPRNALRAGNMPAALACFGKAGRRQDFAGKLLRAADVDERVALAGDGFLDFGQERAQRVVRRFRRVAL